MTQRSFTSALLFGATAGLRMMTAPAMLALGQQRNGGGRLWALRSPTTVKALSAMALGELVLDKLPFTPKRIAAGPLSGRLLAGAMCGAAVAREDQQAGALLGIAGALAASFAGYAIRKSAVESSGLPDAVVALAEDVLAIGMGMAAASMESEAGVKEMGFAERAA